MTRDPRTGKPATLCPCGHLNNWFKIADQEYNPIAKRRYEKPSQCEKCARQLKQRFNPDGSRQSASDQKALNGQYKLSMFEGKKCRKK